METILAITIIIFSTCFIASFIATFYHATTLSTTYRSIRQNIQDSALKRHPNSNLDNIDYKRAIKIIEGDEGPDTKQELVEIIEQADPHILKKYQRLRIFEIITITLAAGLIGCAASLY